MRAVRSSPRRQPLSAPLRWTAWAVLLLYPLGAGVLLLTADGWAVNRANVRAWELTMGPLGLQPMISPEMFSDLANVVLFVPVFAALAVLRPRWWWVLLGAAISTAVETYQLTLPGRDATVVDVLTNTIGAVLGVALGIALAYVDTRGRRRTRSRRLSDAAGPPAAPAPSAPTTPAGAPPGSAGAPAAAPDGRD